MRRLALTPLLIALAAASPAAAKPTHAQALHALAQVQQIEKGKGVKTGRELTPALNQLAASVPSLGGSDRTAAEAILARPDDGQADPAGTHKWGVGNNEAHDSPKCAGRFCVHFTDTGDDASTATYAQSMANMFQNEVFPCENGTSPGGCPSGGPGLGWVAPASDGSLGGTACGLASCVDVYIENLFPSKIFGYVAPDPGQPQSPAIPHWGYMVMDKDFSRYSTTLTGDQEMRVTAAHEYNHLLQDAYDYLEDPWMFESTAVYMEDKVYPDINDYLNYVQDWVAFTRQPLTTFSDSNLKAYGSGVWNHWLDHRYGPAVVRSAWEQSNNAADFAPSAYTLGISGLGGSSFSDEFDRFSAAVAEWDAPGSGFPDRYPDVPRDGSLPAGNATVPFALAHTTFALFDVPVPADNPPTIRLTGTLPAGTAGAVALVGRTGTDPNAGTVTSNLTPMPSGGSAAVSLDNPAQFGRITAVVVNSDPSHNGFDQNTDDWIFTKDASGVSLALAEPGPPIPMTGVANTPADHAATVNGTVDPHLLDTTWTVEYGPTIGYGSSSAAQTLPGSTVGAAPVAVALANLRASTTYHYRLVAANGGGRALGGDATFTTARDVTKPAVSLTVRRQRLARVRRSGLLYLARCSEHCSGTATLIAGRRVAKRLGLPASLGKAGVRLAALPASKTLRVRLSRQAAVRLRGLTRGFSVTLRLRVADDAGNAVTLHRRVVLR